MKKYFVKNEQGQVILFVVVTMVIALGLGIAVSARTLTSLSRVSDTDTSSRVLASAEGGAERMLQKPYDELEEISTRCDTYDNALAESDCVYTYEYSANPPLKTRAVGASRNVA